MGGTGIGHWTYHDKKRTVEECWTLSISDMDRVVDLRTFGSASGSASGTLRPIKPATGKRMSSVHCTPKVGNEGRQHSPASCPANMPRRHRTSTEEWPQSTILLP
jgi:hypothetical protein